MRILVSGMIAADPGQGGATWAVIQYVLGLRELGHDVFLVEPIDRGSIRPANVPLAEQVASRFRLSGAQKKRLATAAAHNGEAGDARSLAYRLGMEQALDRLLMAGHDASGIKEWEIPSFPLKGGEIVARGVKAGPEVARILQAVEARWVAEGFPPRDRVMALLDETLET